MVLRQQQLDFQEGFKWNALVHRKPGEVDWPNPNLDVAYSEAWVAIDEKSCLVVSVPKITGRYSAALRPGVRQRYCRRTGARPGSRRCVGRARRRGRHEDDILNERPAPPPSTSSPLMERELAEVKRAVDGLTRAQMAIVYKWADGVSTPTPPGHWNFIAAPYIRDARFSEVRAARAFALLNMAMHDAAVGCWAAKYAYFNPRPSQLDPSIRTIIGLPNFPAYTSGHSTFSSAAARVLSYLFPNAAAFFEAQRDEASLSRLYGGIHYRSDIEVGKEHGQRIGGYTVRFAELDGADR